MVCDRHHGSVVTEPAVYRRKLASRHTSSTLRHDSVEVSMPRVLLLVLVLTTACTSRGSDPDALMPTGDQPVPTISQGELVVDVTRKCCFIEGSIFFLDVRTTEGELVRERSYWAGELEFVMREALDPGDYSIVSYERPCEASCPEPGETDSLDPPTNRCRTSVTIDPGETYRLKISAGAGVGCLTEG
jgi:hypothetical protein